MLDLRCLQSEQHFEAVTVKLSINAITTKKIPHFQNSVTRLYIIVMTQTMADLQNLVTRL